MKLKICPAPNKKEINMFYNNFYINNFNKKQIECQPLLKYLTSFCPNYLHLILCFALFSNLIHAQECADAGNYWNQSWMSCEETATPNPARNTSSHWLQYEFIEAQSIDSIRIWNANRLGESNMGAQDIQVDYSTDGTNWVTNAVNTTIPQGSEQDDYEGYLFASGFEDIFVQKILIVITNNYGDVNCASIAEVKFDINTNACYGVVDECGECDGPGTTTWYLDADGDGLGHEDTAIQACTQPTGYVDNKDDYCDNNLLGWNEVSAIFSDNGCTGCHGTNATGGLDLTTYDAAIMGGNKCSTNILSGTTLTDIITVSNYAGCGTPIGFPSMNERVGGQIDANELALLQTWIDAGAPEDCNCLAGAPDADNDQTCDAIDDCPNFDNRLIGTSCDDGIVCTENDVWTAACTCEGTKATDSDSDGVCDMEDTAPNDPCTADGIIDGIEPSDWFALPTNDCDTDGINNVNGDLNDFSPCINNRGPIGTAACNCPTNMSVAGGRFLAASGISTPYLAEGLPDGIMTSNVTHNDSLHLYFPYMSVGEEICITLGFFEATGAANFSVNNNSFTFLNPTGLGNYQAQEVCFYTRTEGEQIVIIQDVGDGSIRVDGSIYNYCPCSTSDPKYDSPSCNCNYDTTAGGGGTYVESNGVNNSQNANGAPDGTTTNGVSGSDYMVLDYPNITPGGEICITLSFSDTAGVAKFEVGDESFYFQNQTQTIATLQEVCFVNTSGSTNVTITDVGSGVTYIDGSRYNYCSDCPNAPIKAELHTWLEGSYDPTLREMTTTLHTRGLLPGQTPVGALATPTPAGQPYTSAPWNYTGTEGAVWNDNNYVNTESDWVLVSFRTGTAKNTQVAMTAALLNRDGSIRFPDRCALPAGNTPLYVVVEHRNHMGVMSSEAIDIQNNVLQYDFRRNDSYKDVTSFGQKQLPTGEWVMFAGDGDQSDLPSFDILGSDKTLWFDNNGVFDYYLSPDFNLDGDVNGQDKSLWFENNGISSRVPK